jgi:quinol monooxygenase YgiN
MGHSDAGGDALSPPVLHTSGEPRKESAMYGTIFRLQPRKGHEEDVVAHFDTWAKTQGERVEGAHATYLLDSERRPGELVGVAVFDDKSSYQANASSPEQDAWYRDLREMLETDPIWEDGTYPVSAQY